MDMQNMHCAESCGKSVSMQRRFSPAAFLELEPRPTWTGIVAPNLWGLAHQGHSLTAGLVEMTEQHREAIQIGGRHPHPFQWLEGYARMVWIEAQIQEQKRRK